MHRDAVWLCLCRIKQACVHDASFSDGIVHGAYWAERALFHKIIAA